MKILMIGPRIVDLQQITTFGAVWAYYLRREFMSLGHELLFVNRPLDLAKHAQAMWASDVAKSDFALALGRRGLSRMTGQAVGELWHRTSFLAQLSDTESAWSPGIDTTFCVRAVDHHPLASTEIGWAVDGEVMRPRQAGDVLRIIVDHPDYTAKDDRFLDTLKMARQFVTGGRWRAWTFSEAEIYVGTERGFVPDGVATIRPVRPNGLPYPALAEQLGRAHVFMPTHTESVGLNVLEAAACGALIVARRGMIAGELLNTIAAVTYLTGDDPWSRTLSIDNHRKIALANTWRAVAARIIDRVERGR